MLIEILAPVLRRVVDTPKWWSMTIFPLCLDLREMFAFICLFGIDIDNIDVLMMLRSPWMSLVLVLATTLTLIIGLFEVHVKTADLATDVSNFSEYWKQKQVRK